MFDREQINNNSSFVWCLMHSVRLCYCIIATLNPIEEYKLLSCRSIEFPRVIVGHHTSRNEFSEKYLRKFKDHVVVFVQDEVCFAF